jgi:hypothetical protein
MCETIHTTVSLLPTMKGDDYALLEVKPSKSTAARMSPA